MSMSRPARLQHGKQEQGGSMTVTGSSNHDHDSWHILVVDDDQDVHDVTRLSLHNSKVLGRKLKLSHASSASQARELLARENDIAVILLDVVMETDDSGLCLVQDIRQTLGLSEVRIILRTGQPGYAPEEKVIREYDINDYKTKQELTHTHLLTSVIAAVRSFQQIRTINQSRAGLHKIVSACSNLLKAESLQEFSDGVITQIASLLGLHAEGLLCASLEISDDDIPALNDKTPEVFILGAAGRYAGLNRQPLDELDDDSRCALIRKALSEKQHIVTAGETVLYFGHNQHSAAIYLQTTQTIEPVNKELIELFLHNISIAYQNVTLFQQLRSAAFADPLTRLPNRNEFIRLLQLHADSSPGLVVVLLDLKNFSEINDGLGQDVGDDLLCAVARRLRLTFGADTAIARIDSDVFGLIGHESTLNPLTILAAFDTPFESGDQRILISATLGIGQMELLGSAGMTRLKRAYIALNSAKRNLLSNYAYYAPKMEEDTQHRLLISRALRDALADRVLQVWYQPQFDLKTRTVAGVEALLRWPQKDGEFIPPNVFIPIAEHSGFIVDIGDWVIGQVCHDLSQLQQDGYPSLRAAVNISMPQFRSTNFISCIINALSKNKVEPARLELEITESVLIDEPELVISALKQLKQLGVTISIDDFGTGFSSLSYLRHLPVDRMKVDRSFVRDINQPGGHVIIESILSLGRQMGLRTIAEGIETPEQEKFVCQHHCDEGQGYLYAQAMPLPALKRFLTSKNSSPDS